MEAKESADPVPVRPRLIKSPQDFWGALALLLLAVGAWFATAPLVGRGTSHFGAATAPRLFAAFIALMCLVVMVTSLITAGPPFEKLRFRGPVMIVGAILVFAFAIRPLGLMTASFLTTVIASFATSEAKPIEALVVGLVLAILCSGIFVYGLGLPMPLWPDL